MVFLRILPVFFFVLIMCSSAFAGNFGVGAHTGYGVFTHEEKGQALRAESTQDVVLFGVSGEYSFERPDKFFVGLTTDWTIGRGDTEKWTVNGQQAMTSDMEITGQFYDLRFGYKNSLDRFYYRVYVSGGWDGIYFKRKNFTGGGTGAVLSGSRDYSLWRVGAGAGFGYRTGKWALDARAAYSYNPTAEVDDGAFNRFTFDTNGTCLDLGLGAARSISDRLGLYAGGSYTEIMIDRSETINGYFVSETETRLTAGVINITYAF